MACTSCGKRALRIHRGTKVLPTKKLNRQLAGGTCPACGQLVRKRHRRRADGMIVPYFVCTNGHEHSGV